MIQIHSGKRGKYNNAATGRFFPLNPEKFQGNSVPIYKSSLELRMMLYLDKNHAIVKWSYEPKSIKYFDKSTNKVRRYFIDFTAIAKVGPTFKTLWIEVKPLCESRPPKNKNNVKAVMTWLCNSSKWTAARQLAKSAGAEFVVITEELLN